MQTAYRTNLGNTPFTCKRSFFPDLIRSEQESPFLTRFFGKTAKTTGIDTDIRYVDILVPDIGDPVSYSPFPHFVSGCRDIPQSTVTDRHEHLCLSGSHPVAPEDVIKYLQY